MTDCPSCCLGTMRTCSAFLSTIGQGGLSWSGDGGAATRSQAGWWSTASAGTTGAWRRSICGSSSTAKVPPPPCAGRFTGTPTTRRRRPGPCPFPLPCGRRPQVQRLPAATTSISRPRAATTLVRARPRRSRVRSMCSLRPGGFRSLRAAGTGNFQAMLGLERLTTGYYADLQRYPSTTLRVGDSPGVAMGAGAIPSRAGSRLTL
jgi:hypothetical protein